MTNTLHWFRRDLRLADNPALTQAARAGAVLPVYILDPDLPMGAAARAWLHRSLCELDVTLKGALRVYAGDPAQIIPDLIAAHEVSTVTWTRRYDAPGRATDTALKSALKQHGINVLSANGSLLWEPMEVHKSDGTPYRVFTPFFRNGCAAAPPPRAPLPAPNISVIDAPNPTWIDDLHLRPTPRWDDAVLASWTPGETGATDRLITFINTGLDGYKTGRDLPAAEYVSRLSPHLAFGELSPNTAWHAAKACAPTLDQQHFLSELGWREFSYNLLYHNPDMATRNLNPRFDAFPWRKNPGAYADWQKGQTGIPIVDAGMRELWQTGYMHNRVRMIAASFLVKNLGVHWHFGLKWFDETLFDADPANNPAAWQWVAGSGADAAPFFRIFNPVNQSRRFDPNGTYLRRYLPELAQLSDKHIHAPWEAPQLLCEAAGVRLGITYPLPLTDLKESHARALIAFQGLKSAAVSGDLRP